MLYNRDSFLVGDGAQQCFGRGPGQQQGGFSMFLIR
jgi:hypothetical protein